MPSVPILSAHTEISTGLRLRVMPTALRSVATFCIAVVKSTPYTLNVG